MSSMWMNGLFPCSLRHASRISARLYCVPQPESSFNSDRYRMSIHNNVSADDASPLKHDIPNYTKSSPDLTLAAGLPKFTHTPLHLDPDWSSDTTPPSSLASQSKFSSSSSLPAMIAEEPSSDTALKSSRRRMDFHATRSSPGPRGALDGDYSLHDESPFEAARRAQQKLENAEDRQLTEKPSYIPGKSRFPSIKPGEIVPRHLIWMTFDPPTFLPPLEAPPFPPGVSPVQHPIRPAHFPGSSYQPPALHRSATQIQPPLPSHSPSPAQNNSIPHPHPQSAPGPTKEVDARHFVNPQQPGPQAQPYRVDSPAHSSRSAPGSVQPHPPPPSLVRSNTDSLREVPSSLRPHDGKHSRAAITPLSMPRNPPPPQPRSAPPTRAPSQRHFEPPPLPGALTPIRDGQPPRIPGHQPHTPSPLHSDYVPTSSPVRLPSENFRRTHSDHGHGVSENGGARPTPKPIMPPLLAGESYHSADEKGSAILKRSVSNNPSKGGLFSRTKSLLRKRTSTSTIRLNTDGSIGLNHNALSTLDEEGRKGSNKLSKKK